MTTDGVQMNAWLNKILRDQNITGIGDLENIILSDEQRLFFLSQIIDQNIDIGYYDPVKGKPILGVPSPNTGQAFTTASVGSMTVTAPADERYRVYFAGGVNITAGTAMELINTVGGVSPAIPLVISPLGSTTEYNVVIGSNGSAGVAANNNVMKEMWVEPGDSITIACAAFAGGNNTEYIVLYERYRA